jgi:chromosomal replication initiator protein
MSLSDSPSIGAFATARRFDAERARELLENGAPVQRVARMAGGSVADVQRLRQTVPSPVSEYLPVRCVLSLWRGLIAVPLRTSWKVVAQEVAGRHGVSLEELIGPSRLRVIAHARQEAFFVLYESGRATTPQIGRWFGGRDHTTVIHGIRAHKRRLEAG